MADDLRAFYEFHAGMLEPWDGPAAIAFCDGRQAGATLDRNGLRPCRYQVTRDGLLVLASEAGVLELDPAEVVVNDRLRPGQMLIVDTDAGRIRGDDEIKRALARRRPYRALLDEQKIYLEDIPSPPVEPPARDALERDLRAVRLHRRGTARHRSRRWRATARSRSPRWASTRRWPRSRAARGCCAASSSSSSPRSRTPPSTRSARRS